jgi:hypothetical protein
MHFLPSRRISLGQIHDRFHAADHPFCGLNEQREAAGFIAEARTLWCFYRIISASKNPDISIRYATTGQLGQRKTL